MTAFFAPKNRKNIKSVCHTTYHFEFQDSFLVFFTCKTHYQQIEKCLLKTYIQLYHLNVQLYIPPDCETKILSESMTSFKISRKWQPRICNCKDGTTLILGRAETID